MCYFTMSLDRGKTWVKLLQRRISIPNLLFNALVGLLKLLDLTCEFFILCSYNTYVIIDTFKLICEPHIFLVEINILLFCRFALVELLLAPT